MKVCVVGVGAIGGFIGTRLALAQGCELSAFARGATLQALRTQGWRLQQGGQVHAAPAVASDSAADLGVQDLVIIAVKGPALAAVAPQISPLLAAHTVLLPAMNGVPWWFGATTPALGNEPLASIDPGGRLLAALPAAQVLGCVVHASASLVEPGWVGHKAGRGLIIGEPMGGESARAHQVAVLLRAADFDVQVSPDIRRDLWYKLWGNMTMNPISAFTGATVDRLLADPLVRNFCTAVMREAAAVGDRIGCRVDERPEARHQITAKLGAFKTSMLQDVEAGRPIELDALVTVVRDMAQRLAVPTPHLDALLGLARAFGRERGLYAAPAA
jgi:2-dehydropantoate 2-reductase